MLKKGDSLSAATFDTLRHSLMKAIETQGLPGAVSYCQTQAMPLTHTYATQGISIERVAEKYRNPDNQLDNTDAVQWAQYVQQKGNGDRYKPVGNAGQFGDLLQAHYDDVAMWQLPWQQGNGHEGCGAFYH